ncbi:hypothetical protein BDB01DRAFT_130942 [Pilobolus umbonatus]|nr:hypothetical protein BDB01DRAFT_130942 [Pilobolus umbonatus]
MPIDTYSNDKLDFTSFDEGALSWINWSQGETMEYRSGPSRTMKKTHTREKPKKAVHNTTLLKSVLSDTVFCFCDKPAHRVYTVNFGPVLECANYSLTDQNNTPLYVCGFHVHELLWTECKKELEKGETLRSNYPDLKVCSLFNLIFCTVFRVDNDYVKTVHTNPLCFCNKPTILRSAQTDNGYRFSYSCRNKDGPKCGWVLSVKQLVLPGPRTRIHQIMDERSYLNGESTVDRIPITTQRKEEEIGLKDLKITEDVVSTPRRPMDEHKLGLLNTLLSTLTTTKPYDIPNLNSLCLNELPPAQKYDPLQNSHDYLSSIPSLENKLNRSDLHTRVNSLEYELKGKGEELKKKEEESKAFSKMKVLYESSTKTIEKLHKLIYLQRLEKDEEFVLRTNAQERLSTVEKEKLQMVNEKEKLLEEIEQMRELSVVDGNAKCKVCFNRSIEYALLPCFHLAYCDICVSRLSECAICRQKSIGVQKVYLC